MSTEQIIEKFEALRPSLERFRQKIELLIEELIESHGIEVVNIESRTKTSDSFQEKITREGKTYTDPIKDVTDLAGVRIICYFNEDVDVICREIRKEFLVDENASIEKKTQI